MLLADLMIFCPLGPIGPTNFKKINKIKKHDVPDLYHSLHRIRFYLEFCLQFRKHGNVSIIKMWSLNDNIQYIQIYLFSWQLPIIFTKNR
jgi:hypothetical protein